MREIREVLNLGSFTATGAGTAVQLKHRNAYGLSIYLYGTFAATLKVEVSPDGTNWVTADDVQGDLIESKTAAGVFILAGDHNYIRGNCTAYTSGTAELRAT